MQWNVLLVVKRIRDFCWFLQILSIIKFSSWYNNTDTKSETCTDTHTRTHIYKEFKFNIKLDQLIMYFDILIYLNNFVVYYHNFFLSDFNNSLIVSKQFLSILCYSVTDYLYYVYISASVVRILNNMYQLYQSILFIYIYFTLRPTLPTSHTKLFTYWLSQFTENLIFMCIKQFFCLPWSNMILKVWPFFIQNHT